MTEHDPHAEAAEAQALVDALLDRIRTGDDSVGPDELDNARKLAEFAQLRVEAAEHAVREAERQAASAEIAQVSADIADYVDRTSTRTDALAGKAVKALAAYVDALEQEFAEAMDLASRVHEANLRADEMGIPNTREAHGAFIQNGTFRCVDGRSRTARMPEPAEIVDAVLKPVDIHLAWGAHVELGPTRRNLPVSISPTLRTSGV